MDSEAKAAWIEFHDAIERELVSWGELYDVRDVASKSADNVARLAALFHAFNSKNSNNSISISAECIEAASRIVAWHLNESRRFFGELAMPIELVNAARLDTWLIDYCREKSTHLVPITKLQQCGPRELRRKEAIETTMRQLIEADRARWKQEGKRRMIAVNPALLIEGG
jgi:putative DNA primase/helicase